MDTKNLIAYSKVHEFLLDQLPSATTYQDRMIAQKIGFLAQESGIYLGEMDYFWHKRGPYSRPLAFALRYFEKNRDILVQECSQVRIYQYILPKVDYLRTVINERADMCSEILIWLEICASLKFLSKDTGSKDIDFLSSFLLRKKPFLACYKSAFNRSWELISKGV